MNRRLKHVKNLLQMIVGFREMTSREGGLMPFATAAKFLGVSRQRVNELVAEGTLKPVEFAGRKWLSANQIEEFIKLDREAGRPWHKPSVKEMWKMSREGGRDQVKEK